jgi:1,4-dihydroxy-2-naphthoate octaprenyltransferase
MLRGQATFCTAACDDSRHAQRLDHGFAFGNGEPQRGAYVTTGPARIWLLAIRPATLPASVSGVVVGLGAAAASGAALRLDLALGCLGVALLLQVAANLANDLSDFKRGADTSDRLGPTRVASAGLVTVRQLEIAVVSALAVAGLIGGWLALVGGPLLVVLGAAAMLAALGYTGGPLPYGYHGLGELFVFTFFGLVAVIGTAELQSGAVEPLYVLAAFPIGTLTTAILVVNNLRDTTTDRAANKRTLAVTFGEGFARAEYLVCLLVACIVPICLVVAHWFGAPVPAGPLTLLPLLAVPMAIPLWRAVRTEGDPRRLNAVLGGTGRLTLVFAVLFSLGMAASR